MIHQTFVGGISQIYVKPNFLPHFILL